MELKENYKWSLIVPTSMGIRLTPTAQGQPIHTSNNLFMQATSAETNVANISAYLGLPVKVLTTFVKGSPIAQFIKDNLRSRHMEYEGKEVEQGGPWGYRHQINIADSGFGGALATTFLTDYGQPADEAQVWSIWGGNARVLR